VIGGESSAVKPSGPDSKRQFLPRRSSSFDLGSKGDQGILCFNRSELRYHPPGIGSFMGTVPRHSYYLFRIPDSRSNT
jgi:hypothetical protein